MQNKGVVRLVAILFALACIYQLSFTYVANKIKKDAKEYAQGNIQKEEAYLDSISSEIVYNLGFIKYSFRDCQEREINLGLDLQGGMNVVLEIDVTRLVRSLANYSTDSTFNQAIAKALQAQKQSEKDFITLFGEEFEKIDPNGRLAAIFSTSELRDRINFNSTNKDVLNVLHIETKDAIDNSFNILSARIDQFGVANPRISKLETQGRILIELPGVKDKKRVRKLLQSTADLEFWETYENDQSMYQSLLDANKVIKEMEAVASKAQTASQTVTANENVEEGATTTQTIEKSDTSTKEPSLLQQMQEDTTAASDTAAMSEEQMMADYPLFKYLRPYAYQNGLIPGSVIGTAMTRDTGKVNAYLNSPQVRALFPRDIMFLWGFKPVEDPETKKPTELFELYVIKASGREGKAPLGGEVVTKATAEFGQSGAIPEVSMTMNGDGTKIWARITTDAAGQNPKGCIAIVLDRKVVSSPRVNEPIPNGTSRITGNFSVEEAQDLANMLKSGKLEAPARIIQEEVVGPTLGLEARNAGFNSFVIAFILVLIYMLFFYSRSAGLVADIALFVNVFFLVGVLASLQAVLTLPGIAGIVLTMGMAVDANVIIYERIKEELSAGKGLKLAIKDGYKHAYSAIIDANVTTLLTAVILFMFGTGPVRGFAVTLGIGILTSLFTAIFISRLVFEKMMDKNRDILFTTSFTKNFLRNTKLDFIGARKYMYAFSIILSIAGVISLFAQGLNLGIGFTGGRTYVVSFDQPVNTVDISKTLEGAFGDYPVVRTFGSSNQVKIETKYKINEQGPEIDQEVETKLYEGLKPYIGTSVTLEEFMENNLQNSQKVGPSIADDIKRQAVWAILAALVGIFIYIVIRFKNWRFGLGAIVSMVHDAFVVVTCFSLFYAIAPFSMEIDESFIAAILTVVGYSINDTVIIFDRLREYIGLHPKWNLKDTMNAAMNSTLGRTVNTSMTTIVVLVAIFIFGGAVIKGFIFAMLVGIATGTYSSIFIATPIVYDSIKEKTGENVLKGIRRA